MQSTDLLAPSLRCRRAKIDRNITTVANLWVQRSIHKFALNILVLLGNNLIPILNNAFRHFPAFIVFSQTALCCTVHLSVLSSGNGSPLLPTPTGTATLQLRFPGMTPDNLKTGTHVIWMIKTEQNNNWRIKNNIMHENRPLQWTWFVLLVFKTPPWDVLRSAALGHPTKKTQTGLGTPD